MKKAAAEAVAEAATAGHVTAKATYPRLEKRLRLLLLKRSRLRREGSLAAALAQSMALAVIGTAGAYPSWVLVKRIGRPQLVLGAAWVITRVSPPPDAPILGSEGGLLMLAIAICCILSVPTGSLALTLDFLGRRSCRTLAPVMHGLTAVLIACAAALGSCLLAQIRGRTHTEPELADASVMPGQSLFLAFLACTLASTATGLSCSSPARVEPARSSWDIGRPWGPRFFHSVVTADVQSIPEGSPPTPENYSADQPSQEGHEGRSAHRSHQQGHEGVSFSAAAITALREEILDVRHILARRMSRLWQEAEDDFVLRRSAHFNEGAAAGASHPSPPWRHPSLLEQARSSLERYLQHPYYMDEVYHEREREGESAASSTSRREKRVSTPREHMSGVEEEDAEGPVQGHLQRGGKGGNLGEGTSGV